MENTGKVITISRDGQPIYNIYIEKDYGKLKKVFSDLQLTGRKVCIVSDSNVGPLYIGDVVEIAKDYAEIVETFTFPAGEQSKNLEVVSRLYEHLILSGFERNDVLLALGGGVVGDLTGFAAATYLRGIRFVQLPTSLIAVADSSIGGKTGVDFQKYKNMVGAFYMPQAVYINLSVLKTLTDEQYYSGFAEIIKYGCIMDKPFYENIKAQIPALCKRSLAALEDIIYTSCICKKKIVETDPTEKGERALLNYGHTLGHAIEKLKDFSMLHGECVSVGMVLASRIALVRGIITEEEYEDMMQVCKALHLPVSYGGIEPEEIIRVAKSDKKMDAGKIKFILLSAVGEAYIDRTVTDDEMRNALMEIRED